MYGMLTVCKTFQKLLHPCRFGVGKNSERIKYVAKLISCVHMFIVILNKVITILAVLHVTGLCETIKTQILKDIFEEA